MVSEHAARAWKRFSAILGIRSALADAGVGVSIHGAGHGSSAAAQNFQDPRHAKDPARCVSRSNQRHSWACIRGGCALVRRSGRNFCPIAIPQRKQPTVDRMEGAWTNIRVVSAAGSLDTTGIHPVNVDIGIRHLRPATWTHFSIMNATLVGCDFQALQSRQT
jgi:hypothetical protein